MVRFGVHWRGDSGTIDVSELGTYKLGGGTGVTSWVQGRIEGGLA